MAKHLPLPMILLLLGCAVAAVPLHADEIDPNDPRVPGYLNVRARANYVDPTQPYWEGFDLKNQGQCSEAIDKLGPLASRGRGFEEAQHAYGICLMRLGGLPAEAGAPPPRTQLFSNPQFREGVDWVHRAANANSFRAQRTLVALYAAGLGPDVDPVEAGKWLHLYRINPIRLGLGAGIEEEEAFAAFDQSLPLPIRLEGRERARNWVPSYWQIPSVQSGGQ